MKFFGWERKKDPPPIPSQGFELHYSDVARAAEYGSVEGQPRITRSGGEYSALIDHLDAAETWEERLEETIRFVFSNEQEGLLAIGTFAIDQLVASPHSTDHKLPPSPAMSTSGRICSSSADITVIREVRSSNDETDTTDHSIGVAAAACTSKELISEYPVFGDPGSITPRSSALCTNDDDHKLAEITTSCSHSTTKHVHDQFVDSSDQEFHNAGALCGLFPLFRSRRSLHKRTKPPEKKVAGNSTKGTSLGAHLGRLWRSGCSTGASHRVSPEKDTCLFPPKINSPFEPSQTQGPPCIANCVEESASSEVGEPRKRRSGPSFGNLGWASCAHNGNWIRTDSEFVVLEM